ncbi:hypothetical protein PRIPAC_94559 [Pristionchus pacificus]|uniref:Riboflavin transporter n=1 Tax=Pristionchus pacificus TaxID=54126 RepID=A0A2A6BBN5_PRIPA|nr:hypothetical protein PRIPAC_94559 [Pristionchus pacificus]|eukprot:PDM63295.1 hypothetical protein PRIPAC_50510 [Pristionchus pacificus]
MALIRMNSQWILHLLVLLFGMSAWLSINSIYVQLPILSLSAPESWNLASYIVIIIQVSCLFPLIYSIVRYWKREITDKIESVLIVFLLILDIIGLLLSTFTYSIQTTIGGTQHSLWLFISILILCIPCTMADVLFMPLIGRLGSPSFITTFYVGMGVGALLPSALSFAQGVNGSSFNFSYSIFIYIICVFVLISLAAYFGILYTERRISREEKVSSNQPTDITNEGVSSLQSIILPITVSLVASSFQNAVIPAILPYATQPFESSIYSLSTNLFVLTNPVFCFIQHFFSFSSTLRLSLLSLVAALPTFFLLLLSVVPLSIPSAFLPISSALSAGLLSLLRTAGASRLAHSPHPKALFYCGFATQFGSFVGAITVFLLANLFHIFISS